MIPSAKGMLFVQQILLMITSMDFNISRDVQMNRKVTIYKFTNNYFAEIRGTKGLTKSRPQDNHNKSLEYLGLVVFSIVTVLLAFFQLMAAAAPCIEQFLDLSNNTQLESLIPEDKRKFVQDLLFERRVYVGLCVLVIVFVTLQVCQLSRVC